MRLIDKTSLPRLFVPPVILAGATIVTPTWKCVSMDTVAAAIVVAVMLLAKRLGDKLRQLCDPSGNSYALSLY